MGKTMKVFQLTEDQADLIVSLLKEKRDELDMIIRNSDGLSDDTVRDMSLTRRDIANVIRELEFYSIIT
jgi:hypothetical protein